MAARGFASLTLSAFTIKGQKIRSSHPGNFNSAQIDCYVEFAFVVSIKAISAN